MTSTARSVAMPDGRAPSITAGTTCRFGQSSSVQHSSCVSRFAGSAPSEEIAPVLRWLITSCRFGATGLSLLIQPTTRACASGVTTARRQRNAQIDAKTAKNLAGDRAKAPSAMGARLGPFRVRAQDARSLENLRFSTLPPGRESFCLGASRP